LPADDRLRSATFDFSKCLDWFLTKVAPNAGPSTFGSVWPSIALHLSSTHGADCGHSLRRMQCMKRDEKPTSQNVCVSRYFLKMDREIQPLRSNWWTAPMLDRAIYFVAFDRKARGQKLNNALSEIQHVALALRGSRRHRIPAFQRSSYSDRCCFANLVLRLCSSRAG